MTLGIEGKVGTDGLGGLAKAGRIWGAAGGRMEERQPDFELS